VHHMYDLLTGALGSEGAFRTPDPADPIERTNSYIRGLELARAGDGRAPFRMGTVEHRRGANGEYLTWVVWDQSISGYMWMLTYADVSFVAIDTREPKMWALPDATPPPNRGEDRVEDNFDPPPGRYWWPGSRCILLCQNNGSQSTGLILPRGQHNGAPAAPLAETRDHDAAPGEAGPHGHAEMALLITVAEARALAASTKFSVRTDIMRAYLGLCRATGDASSSSFSSGPPPLTLKRSDDYTSLSSESSSTGSPPPSSGGRRHPTTAPHSTRGRAPTARDRDQRSTTRRRWA
jgi:hypothetical protein